MESKETVMVLLEITMELEAAGTELKEIEMVFSEMKTLFGDLSIK